MLTHFYKSPLSKKYEQLSLDYEQLKEQIKNATEFINSIEKGNLDAAYNGYREAGGEDNNILANALLSMREQMKVYAEEDKERNWTTVGLAKFVEILRSDNTSITQLYDNIISNLVKYLGANQGGLFIVQESKGEDAYLELVACYAYDRKKYIERKVQLGEGLTGQCVLEKETIFLTQVPKNYLSITSGLGDSTPKSLIIVPLKINDKIYGVVEIASFQVFKKYQIGFVEKLGESVASSISNARMNEHTQALLKASQQQAEQLRQQEEEMRQNMEELHATQEQVARQEEEMRQNMEDMIVAMQQDMLNREQELLAEIETLKKQH